MLTETSSRSQFVFLKGSCLQRDGQYQVRFLLTKTTNRAVSVLNVTGLVCGRFDPLDSSPSNTLYSIGTVYVYHISWPEGGGGGRGVAQCTRLVTTSIPVSFQQFVLSISHEGGLATSCLNIRSTLGNMLTLGGGGERGGGSYSLLFPLLHTVRKIHWKSVQRLFLQRLP